jgi:hypothetical protein
VTSERLRGRFVVLVRGKAARMGRGMVNLLLTLMAARVESQREGFVRDPLTAYPMAIHRLRRLLDEAVGSGTGRELIETGVGAEYRIARHARAAVDERVLKLKAAASRRVLRKLSESGAAAEAERVAKLLSDFRALK